MRTGGLLGACRLTARWRVLTLAMVLGMVAAIVGVSSQIASATSVPHHHLRLGAHGAPGSGLTLAQAPAGLRTAVRRTLGLPAVPASSAFQQAKLTAADGAANDQLGWSVAISKSTAVVGAPGKNVNAGAAYVFVRSGTAWSQQAELTAAASDRFGTSVAISGSTVVVGAVGNASGTGAVYVFVRSGTAWSQQAELTASDAASGDAFGSSVAISGSTMAVGAPNKNLQTGAAYVFVRSGTAWSQQAKLTAAGGAANDFFGTSVAISGSTVVVGAYGHNSSTGAAYVFVRSGTAWSQQAELTAADAASGDSFGSSVAISGSMVVVGAYGKNSGIGAAYVFVRSGTAWSQQAELTDAGGTANDNFGFSVAISGSTVVVGTPGKNSNTGAAYVFVPSGTAWSQQAELTAADAASGDIFGFSVAISGSTAVAGARNKNSFTGAAYVFAVPSQQAELTAADAAAQDIFANSVAISGSTAVVGAPFKNSETGAAYVFVRSGTAWSQQAKLTAADAAVNDRLGWSVAISGSTVVVGAPNKDSNTGAAYVFVRSGTAWSQQGKLTAADAAVNDTFGWSVAISGSTAMVGVPGRSGSTGAAYAYVRSGTVWSQQAELTAADGADFDEFGVSVGILGVHGGDGRPGQEFERWGGVCVRAVGDGLVAAGGADRRRRRRERLLRHLRGNLPVHRGGRRPQQEFEHRGGVCVRAVGDGLVAAGRADCRRRRLRRLLRHLRGHFGDHGDGGRPQQGFEHGGGVCVRALGDGLAPASQADRRRRHCGRPIRLLGGHFRAYGGGGRPQQELGHRGRLRIRERVAP